jgi:hypothetical protein
MGAKNFGFLAMLGVGAAVYVLAAVLLWQAAPTREVNSKADEK